jgi:serine protease Do
MRERQVRLNGAVKQIIAGALALGMALPVLSAPLPSRRNEVVEVVEKVAPSVVNIAAEQIVRRRPSMFDEFFFGNQRQRRERSQSLGSGVIIDPKGIILTNDHVISGASKIIATTKSGVELECEVVGSDADIDMAVLRTRKLHPHHIALSHALMRIGRLGRPQRSDCLADN